jgi:dTDP-4-amino-4,6-dideoxygalactose transaminase
MIPIARPDVGPEEAAAVAEVLASGMIVQGKKVAELEERWADYCGVKHAIAVSNGTVALMCIYAGLGLEPGDEVITVSHTFNATVSSILFTGATPVFVDIEPDTYLIDAARIEAKITPRTRVISPVHLFGLVADMDMITAIADRYGLIVVEDAAQAHGARYGDRKAGNFGHAAAYSFYPSKNLGAYGDAGIIVTNDDAAADRLRLLRNYGQRVKYYHTVFGTNSRLDTVQAVVLRVKLPHLESWNAARRRHAAAYGARLPEAVRTPIEAPKGEHIYHLYVIETADRDRLQQCLRARQIDTGIHYPVPAHLQEACAPLGYKAGDFPRTEAAAARILSLPMYPELTDLQIDYVVEAVANGLQ